MKMDNGKKNEIFDKIINVIEIIVKGLVKGTIELVKAIANAFR